MSDDLDGFAEWRDNIESRVGTLEVTVKTQARVRAQMDKDMSDLSVKLDAQGRLLQALADTQSDHTAVLADHTAVLADPRPCSPTTPCRAGSPGWRSARRRCSPGSRRSSACSTDKTIFLTSGDHAPRCVQGGDPGDRRGAEPSVTRLSAPSWHFS